MMYHFFYSLLIYIEFGCSIGVFILLFFISAPYGKHYRSGWGISIPARAAWIIMEFPAFCVILLFFLTGRGYLHPVGFAFIILWEVHYIQRTFVYPFLIVGNTRNFPLLLVAMAFIFNIINGYINGYYLFHFHPPYSLSWFYDPRFIGGTLLFVTGFWINLTSDRILRNLRKKEKSAYVIPRGWFYRYISSPNYFGEIIEWIGWACLTWSLPGVLFAFFTISNLLPRAISNHKWYKAQFPDYPVKRKAIIPFVL